MLTNEEIKNLIVAEKEVFATKEDVSVVKNNIDGLAVAVDKYIKRQIS